MGLFDGQVLPDSVEDPYNEYVAGPADHLAGSTDEAVGRWHDQSQQIAETRGEWSPTQRFMGYLRVTTRHGLGPIGEDAENFAFENEAGHFMGLEDDTDLAGPELGGSSEPGDGGFELSWRNPDASDNDPTHPDNHPAWLKWLYSNPEKVAGLLLAGLSLYLLKPLLELAANLSE